MSQLILKEQEALYEPIHVEIDHIVTEDDTPVDNLLSARQQRLFVHSLYASWKPNRQFLAEANVGIWRGNYLPTIVPDFFLSMDVGVPENWTEKRHRSYFLWEFGKPPELVIEIVSNKVGNELEKKANAYAVMGVWYYVIFDPELHIQKERLTVYQNKLGEFIAKDNNFMDRLGLGVELWDGVFETKEFEWVRWVDADGNILPTADEKAEVANARADFAERRANSAEQRADAEAAARADAEARAKKLAAKLRALGIDLDE